MERERKGGAQEERRQLADVTWEPPLLLADDAEE
jgi:hypothetical protein